MDAGPNVYRWNHLAIVQMITKGECETQVSLEHLQVWEGKPSSEGFACRNVCCALCGAGLACWEAGGPTEPQGRLRVVL